MRTTRQQYLIKQLLHEATSKNLFTQSGQLYQLAKTALQSLNLSEGLADITSLVGLATSMVNLSTDRLYSQTVPITTAPQDPSRVVWAPKAADVWARLQQGQPLVDQPDSTAKDTTGDSSDSGTVESDSSKGSDPTDKNSEPVSSRTSPTRKNRRRSLQPIRRHPGDPNDATAQPRVRSDHRRIRQPHRPGDRRHRGSGDRCNSRCGNRPVRRSCRPVSQHRRVRRIVIEVRTTSGFQIQSQAKNHFRIGNPR